VEASYVANYSTALEALTQLRKSNPAFASFLQRQEAKKKCKGQKLESFLIMPVQRLPRYRLLLEDLVRHTAEGHPDLRSLGDAVETVKAVLVVVNDASREAEALMQVVQIAETLLLKSVRINLVEAHRRFVHRGQLNVIGMIGMSPRLVFLFNDLFLISKYTLNYRISPTDVFPLALVDFDFRFPDDRDDDDDDTGDLVITYVCDEVPRSLTLVADTREDLVTWQKLLLQTQDAWRRSQATYHLPATTVQTEADEG